MCGIAGIVSPEKVIAHQRIKAAADAIQHRGPESEQFYINNNKTVFLAHRRLSIIDLDRKASQPMMYASRFSIIHNGELYNYIEIKKQLLLKGYQFNTQSDTEVIVAAYMAYGTNCLQHFDGMFAFAIWDEHDQNLFAARDRFGEKPFFYSCNDDQFVFASEMKSLWNAGVPKKVNQAMLYNFLTIGYTGNPSNPSESFYEEIQKLPAGCYLNYSLRTHKLTIKKYWQLNTKEKTSVTDKDAIGEFSELLNESIRKRLRSDVAIGTSLSGGLDSSVIATLCSQHVSRQYSYRCFTASFPGFNKNEVHYARRVAEQNTLQHYIIEVSANDVIELMDTVMYHQEAPIASTSAIAQYKLYKTAKENGVTVLLDGQGADEILGGYHKFYKWHWQKLYRENQLQKSGELIAAKNLGVKETFGVKNKVAAFSPEIANTILKRLKTRKAYLHPDLDRAFAIENKESLYYKTPSSFEVNSALYFDTVVYGLEDLLRIADRNSMAHAVEVRLPYLNHHLVEFVFSLPVNFKIRNGWTKWLLRKSMENVLQNEITWRRDKVGFEPPQKQWMSDVKIQELIIEGKKKLVQEKILNSAVLNKKIQPQHAVAADNFDWRYWAASYLF